MPVEPRDARDGDDVRSDGSPEDGGVDTPGELPLVVPVSDTIGAVDLGMPDDHDAPAGSGVVSDADVPTGRHGGREEPAGGAGDGTEVEVPTDRQDATTGSQQASAMDVPTGRHETADATTVQQPVEAKDRRAASDPTPVAGSPPVVDLVHDEPEPRRRWWLRVLLVLGLVLALVVGYYLFTLWQVWSTGRGDEARSVDAIVVMGAAQYDGRPSPQLAARLDHAATLWSEGLAANVIVTGGNQPGDRFTEAEASGAYLVERGVPSEALRYENTGANTYDSLVGVAAIMRAEGLTDALLVTDPYHALRSRLTAEELGIVAYTSPTPSSVVTGAAQVRRELGEAAGVALGRIIGFDRLASLSG
jgi:uncharacterized SAM-binding protein YcdF (DUF218 family)